MSQALSLTIILGNTTGSGFNVTRFPTFATARIRDW
jgi:hypothetical protein